MPIFDKKGFSVVEYAVLFIIVISAFLIMQHYMQRGVFGMWAQSGKSFAFGRQFDAQKSIECDFDEQTNLWYDHNCFVASNCSIGATACETGCAGYCYNQ